MTAERILRCSDGHLYTSSALSRLFLSMHLGPKRLERCAVDHRWRLTENVDPGELTETEIRQAHQNGTGAR